MRLAVTWEMAGYVDVEADTLEDAMEKFKKECDYIKLPNGDYVDGSFRFTRKRSEDKWILKNRKQKQETETI